MSETESSDQKLAFQLQSKFDEEYEASRTQEENDFKFAMNLVGKHDMSDSDPEPVESNLVDAYEADTETDVMLEEDDGSNVQKETCVNEASPNSPTENSKGTQIFIDDDSDETPDEDEICKHLPVAERPQPTGINDELSVSSDNLKKMHEISDSDSDAKPSTSNMANSDKTFIKIKDMRPICKYGNKCFRKNSEHLKQFQHFDTASAGSEIPLKRAKLDSVSKNVTESYQFYLSSVAGIPNTANMNAVLSIQDILSPKWGSLVASAQFNYMTDVNWLVSQYPPEFNTKPLLVVHGYQHAAKKAIQKDAAAYRHVVLCQAKLEIMFGTHHTKMMLLQYEDGMRIVIHTANLVHSDWHQKTQGIWMSPKFPHIDIGRSAIQDSQTNFRKDLLEYLKAYNSSEIMKWCEIITRHDFSSANVFLIASTPGRHTGVQKFSYGHLKLRKILRENGPSMSSVNTDWSIIAQFSSIGSLGPSSESWMCKEFIASLSTTRNLVLDHKFPQIQLIFPSVENVRLCLEGYPAGASLPYSNEVAVKQKWLNAFLHQWKSEHRGRSYASPHIKTFCRVSPDSKSLAWFLVTSANLSKAAWGALEKNNSQLMIRSYELGVLLLPQYFSNNQESCSSFSLSTNPFLPNSEAFPMPYDLPLIRYRKTDQPWIWNISHTELPDRHGNVWQPD